MFETMPKYRPLVVLMGFNQGKFVFVRYEPETGSIEKIVVAEIVAEAVKLFWDVKQDKIRGIKLVRERYELGLREAKELVEGILGQL
jgi:ribosomal protein L7/L12